VPVTAVPHAPAPLSALEATLPWTTSNVKVVADGTALTIHVPSKGEPELLMLTVLPTASRWVVIVAMLLVRLLNVIR